MTSIDLPLDGRLARYELTGRPVAFDKREGAAFSRLAFAAAHVVADPLADNDP